MKKKYWLRVRGTVIVKIKRNYIKKNRVNRKKNPCKIVCSSKSVLVQFYFLVPKCLHPKVSLCSFVPSCKFDSYPLKT